MSASLISRFGRDVSISTPIANGEYVNGIWQEPLRETIQIRASVQPLTPKEVLMLPEADRQKERIKLYSTYLFKVQKEGDMTPSDYTTIDGKTYMCVAVTNFVFHKSLSIQYYRGDFVLANGLDA